MKEAYFINENGKAVFIDGVNSHIQLATQMLENDKALEEEFKKSNMRDPVDFLVINKGYIKTTNFKNYKAVTFSEKNLSKKQKEVIEVLANKGFTIDDIDLLDKDPLEFEK